MAICGFFNIVNESRVAPQFDPPGDVPQGSKSFGKSGRCGPSRPAFSARPDFATIADWLPASIRPTPSVLFMPNRRRNWNFGKNLAVCTLLAVVLFMGVLPLVEPWLSLSPNVSLRMEWIRSRIMETVVAIWFFAFGSMVGSFINVVVWRMPRGVSVVSRGSACPHCRARIRLADNIPIFGWLKLGGRCRVCRLPISPRYPIVEAIFGSAFLLVFLAEVTTAGGNLPGGSRHATAGILQVVLTTKWDIIALYAFHMTLITLLFAWALMQLDGSRIPQKTTVFALLVGFAAPVALSYLQPVNWTNDARQWLPEMLWLHGIATGFIGLAAGFMLGEFLDQFAKRDPGLPAPAYLRIGLMSTGLFLGWQALATVVLMTGLIWMAQRVGSARRWTRFVPWLAGLAVAVIIQVCGWRWLDELVGGDSLRPWRFALALGLGTILAAVAISRRGTR